MKTERADLAEQFQRYLAVYPTESTAISRCLDLLHNPEAFVRTGRPGHFTASMLILDQSRTFVLLVKHRKLGIWLQPGGHVDGDYDLVESARREMLEETGVGPVAMETDILDVDIHPIPTREEESAHDHYDIRYLAIADRDQPLLISDESTDLKWVGISEIRSFTEEETMIRMLRKAGVESI